MFRIVVLISDTGTGTNLQAIIKGINKGKINAEIAAVISDTPKAPGLKRARKYKLPVRIISKKEELLETLKNINPDYICLAGWKQIILAEVIDGFPGRILNIHPGLIPDTADRIVKNPDGTDALWNKGKKTERAIQGFLDGHFTYAGCTSHILSHEFDFGPVLGRVFEKIKQGDSVESLYKRLKVKENKLYVEVLTRLTKLKTVLIVDGGGRGAVLVDKYGQSKQVGKILVVPGNDLMQINTDKSVITHQHLKTTDVKEILQIAKQEKVDIVDVAQDNAVAVGLVDELIKLNITAFGPTKKAGQIEWDKAWARNFMSKYKILSPKFHIFHSEKTGIEFVKKYPGKKWFIKAAGLAEGKGVISADNIDGAITAIKSLKKFGQSGESYLLEEWLVGEEFSAFALCDGINFEIVGFAQDHKRVNDGDVGPNTGGMGCVSNPLVVDKNIRKQTEEIFKKTVNGLIKEKRPYKGVLYLGGIVVEGRVFVIEFNARWGDPEAEVIIPSIQNDFIDLVEAVIRGKLRKLKIEVDKKIRVAVTLVAKGYPGDYGLVKGKKVLGIEQAIKTGVKIYGAGIKEVDGDFAVNGGRILFVMGEGDDIVETRKKVYRAIKLINVEGDNLHYRTDIGWRDLERVKGKA